MDRPTIAVSPNMSQYFEQVVTDALKVRQIEASEAASTYLVGILCDYAHPNEEEESPFTKPLTFLLRDAMEAVGADRFRRLRNLGDGILYALGFFGGHIEHRGVDRRYVVGVGSAAYGHAAAMLRLNAGQVASGTNVLSELAIKFERFAQVLADIAEGTLAVSVRDGRSIVKLYERWMRTGSARLAEELGALGIIPVKSKGGMN